MGPKSRHQTVKKTSKEFVDCEEWIDDLQLADAIVDNDTVMRAYRLDATYYGNCSAPSEGRLCSFRPLCLIDLRTVKNTSSSLARLVDKLAGPAPEALDGAEEECGELKLNLKGVRNLGNTCYMNSILQLVFHCAELRVAVVKEVEVAPCGEIASSGLPALFLEMGFSKCAAADPSSFLSFLHIDRTVQQDAQEFFALLMHWFFHASSGSTSSSSELAGVLNAQFEGLQLYTRRCSNCGAEVKKIERFSFLSVSPISALTQGIQNLCQPEDVEGFQCAKCTQTVTATSTMTFKKLPNTLVVHFTRFSYDTRHERREKVDTNVTFPTILEMTPTLAIEKATAHRYCLMGVVNHLGPSPNSGHYTYHAKVGDAWLSFDDSEVTKLRRYYGDTTSSRDAYILVYKRIPECEELSANVFSDNLKLEDFPESLRDHLVAKHLSIACDYQTWKRRRDEATAEVKEWSSLAESVLNSVNSLPVGSYFVSTAWLRKFGGMFLSDDSSSSAPILVENEEVERDSHFPQFPLSRCHLCPHGKLSLDADVKVIPETIFVELLSKYSSPSAEPTLVVNVNTGLCRDCALDFLRKRQSLRFECSREKKMKQLANVKGFSGDGFFVSAEFLDSWLSDETMDFESVDLTNDIVCPHGNLSSSRASRLVCVEVFRFLVGEKLVACSRQFPTGTSICDVCNEESTRNTSQLHSIKLRKLQEGKSFPSLLADDVNRQHLRRDLAAQVRKLKKAWDDEQQQKQLKQDELAAALEKKRSGVKIHKSNKGTPEVQGSTADDVVEVCPPRRVHYPCLPMTWVMEWRRWYRDLTHTNEKPCSRPSTRELLCRHGSGLAFDYDSLIASPPPAIVLSASEYEAITKEYGKPTDPEVFYVEDDERRYMSPGVCLSCHTTRLDEERRTKFFFKDGIIGIEGKVKKSKKHYFEFSESFGGIDCSDTLHSLAERLCTRLLEAHGLFVQIEWIQFSRKKTPNAASMYDMQKTFAEQEISQQSTIYVVVNETASRVESHCKTAAHEESLVDQTKREAEVTFSSSKLHGLNTVQATAPSSISLRDCSVCTFSNAPTAKKCEMCDSEL